MVTMAYYSYSLYRSRPTHIVSSTPIMALGPFFGFYRSCLFQIIIVGLVAFCEPGIWTALNNLGAGGNASVSKSVNQNFFLRMSG